MEKLKNILKGKKFKIGIGSVILFIVIFIAINNLNKGGIVLKGDDDTVEQMVLSEFDKIENKQGNKFGIYNEYLYKWENGKIFLRNLEKEGDSYNLSLNISTPIIVPGSKYLFVTNPEEGIIYYVNSKGEMVERMPLNQPIFSVKEENDNLIYHTKKYDDESIGIIDSELNNVMKYDYNGETVLEYDYYPNNNKVAIAVLNVDEKSIGTRLDLYTNLKDKETIYFDKEVVTKLKYINLGNLLVLTDNNLYYISENEVVWQKDLPLAKDILVTGSKIHVLYGNHLMELDTNGEEKKNITLSNQYNRLTGLEGKMFSENLIAYNDSELVLIKNGEEVLKHNQDISRVDTWKDTIFILDRTKYGFFKEEIKEKTNK